MPVKTGLGLRRSPLAIQRLAPGRAESGRFACELGMNRFEEGRKLRFAANGGRDRFGVRQQQVKFVVWRRPEIVRNALILRNNFIS
jgi:hypothetical protein